MIKPKFYSRPRTVLIFLLRWIAFILPMAVTVGSLVAFFLYILDQATAFRCAHPWPLWLLPIAGLVIYFVYRLDDSNSEAGNNLIMDEIHSPGGGIPKRMTPLVLGATVVTHLFGGSAGREGTAVQMGGSIASFFSNLYKSAAIDQSTLLMAGMSAGFGAVFGTPLAGAVFALEVLVIGKIRYQALIPCLIAGLIADATCSAWGIHHTPYTIGYQPAQRGIIPYLHLDMSLLAKVAMAGVAFGLVSLIFARLSHFVKHITNQYIRPQWLIPLIGGAAIITLTYIIGTRDYLGLGVTACDQDGVSIVSAFHRGGAAYLSWAWKLVFTVITLGTGFKGGEVTPLFFIGATLGNIIATLSHAPIDLFAGLGFIAVFAGATNTPLACMLMGVELFGGENLIYYAVACFVAYCCSGPKGIYTSQRHNNIPAASTKSNNVL